MCSYSSIHPQLQIHYKSFFSWKSSTQSSKFSYISKWSDEILMISDLFRSPCWSRKCLVRLPQFREHDYRGLITSPDPELNRQKITRLCYDFCLRYGEWISKGRHLLDTFFALCRCLLSLNNLVRKWETKISKCRHVFCLLSTLFSRKNYVPPWRSDSRPSEAPNSIFIYAKEGQKSSTQPFNICWQFSR